MTRPPTGPPRRHCGRRHRGAGDQRSVRAASASRPAHCCRSPSAAGGPVLRLSLLAKYLCLARSSPWASASPGVAAAC